MLQQTRVETVIPYYERFHRAFPTVQSLAYAKADRVMKLWEGLGYYTRARNLMKTARIVVRDYRGEFPKTLREWLALPGIGRYTAGAVVSIAFQLPAPVLDGNVKRVLSRIFMIAGNLSRGDTVNALWETATALVPSRSPGDFNQAMMELGARICTPKNPNCRDCPIRKWCGAFSENRVAEFPARRLHKTIPRAVVVAAAIRKNGRYLMGKRPPHSMLAGLWEFPGGKVEAGESHQQALMREIREELGIDVEVGDLITSVDHAYSHLTVTIHLYQCLHVKGKPKPLYHSEIKWIPRSHLTRYALPAANIKFLEYL